MSSLFTVWLYSNIAKQQAEKTSQRKLLQVWDLGVFLQKDQDEECFGDYFAFLRYCIVY